MMRKNPQSFGQPLSVKGHKILESFENSGSIFEVFIVFIFLLLNWSFLWLFKSPRLRRIPFIKGRNFWIFTQLSWASWCSGWRIVYGFFALLGITGLIRKSPQLLRSFPPYRRGAFLVFDVEERIIIIYLFQNPVFNWSSETLM